MADCKGHGSSSSSRGLHGAAAHRQRLLFLAVRNAPRPLPPALSPRRRGLCYRRHPDADAERSAAREAKYESKGFRMMSYAEACELVHKILNRLE